MAKKSTPVTKSIPAKGEVAKAPAPKAVAAPVSTPVRNTPIPKAAAAPVKKTITHEMIAKRAYEIHTSGGGSETDNWHRAEAELRSL